MRRRLIALMLGLVLALGTLSGCGGEGGDDDGEGLNPGLVQPGEDGEGDDDD